MEPGFMLERGGGPRDLQVRWVEGEPIPRLFFAGVKLEGREPMPVTTFRCVRRLWVSRVVREAGCVSSWTIGPRQRRELTS
jgi:hypothetical protein